MAEQRNKKIRRANDILKKISSSADLVKSYLLKKTRKEERLLLLSILAILVIVGFSINTNIFNPQISTSQVVKEVSFNQQQIIVGQPVKQIKYVRVGAMQEGEKFIKLPKLAKNIVVKGSATEPKINIKNLTVKDRQGIIAMAQKTNQAGKSSLILLGSILNFFTKGIGSVGDAIDQLISPPTEEPTSVVEPANTVETGDAIYVNLSNPIVEQPVEQPTELVPVPTVEEVIDTNQTQKNQKQEEKQKEKESKDKTAGEQSVNQPSEQQNEQQVEEQPVEQPSDQPSESQVSQLLPDVLETVSSSDQSVIEQPQQEEVQAEEVQPIIEQQPSPEPEYIAVEYETPAPEIIEHPIENGKEVTVSAPDELEYKNILAFTELDNTIPTGKKSVIKIYNQKADGSQEPVDFTAYDLDNNGKIDYIEWIVPHLSTQVYIIVINISRAQHLDTNKEFVSDIFDQTKAQDGIWSETINNGEYVRVTFEKQLTDQNDITLYARSTQPDQSAQIEVYTEGGDQLIATFENIGQEKTYKIYLTNLQSPTDAFDLKIIGSVEIDYIVDPPVTLYWVGAAGGNISTATNWCTYDPTGCNAASGCNGGTGDASAAPGASDTAIFDADCDNGATVDSAWSLTTLTLSSGYAGTVTQGADVSVSGNLSVSGGTIAAVTYDLAVTGNSTVTGGTLTIGASATNGWTTTDLTIGTSGVVTCSGASKITASGNWDSSAGTFTYSTSIVSLTGTGNFKIIENQNFYNLSLAYTNSTTTIIDNVTHYATSIIRGTLTLNGGTLTKTAGSLSATCVLYASTNSVVFASPTTISITGFYYRVVSGTTQDVIGGNYGSTKVFMGSSVVSSITYTLTGDITTTNLIQMTPGAVGVDLTLNTGNYSISAGYLYLGAGDMSFHAKGTATINFGSSSVTLTQSGLYGVVAGTDTYSSSFTLNLQTSTWNVVGSWVLLSASATIAVDPGSSTVTFTGTNSNTHTITSNSQAFYNLTINSSNSTGVFTLGDNASVTGALAVSAGTLAVRTYNLAVTGNSTVTGGTLTIGASATNGWTTTDLTIGTSGIVTCSGASKITASGNWDSSAGTFTYSTSTVTLTATGGNTTLTTPTSGFYYTAGFYNLTINSGSNKVSWNTGTSAMASNALNITGQFEVGAGRNCNVSSLGTLTINPSSTLSGAGIFTKGTNTSSTAVTNNGTISIASFIYGVNGSATTAPVTATTYGGNLTLYNNNSASGTAVLGSGTLAVTGNFIIYSATVSTTITLDNSVNNTPINVGGSIDFKNGANGNGAYTPGTSTVTLNGTATGKTITSNGQSFYDLTVNGSGGVWTLQDNLAATNNMSVTAGTLNVGAGKTIVVTNTLTMDGGLITGASNNVAITAKTITMNAGSITTTTSGAITLKSTASPEAFTLYTITSAGTVDIGSSTANTTPSSLTINGVITSGGSATIYSNSDITQNADITANVGTSTVDFYPDADNVGSAATYTRTSGTVTSGTGRTINFRFKSGNTTAFTLAGITTAGASYLNIGTVASNSPASLSITGAVTATGISFWAKSKGDITQSATIAASAVVFWPDADNNAVTATFTGSATITGVVEFDFPTAPVVSTFALAGIDVVGTINVGTGSTNAPSSLNITAPITATSTVAIFSNGDITQNANIASSAANVTFYPDRDNSGGTVTFTHTSGTVTGGGGYVNIYFPNPFTGNFTLAGIDVAGILYVGASATSAPASLNITAPITATSTIVLYSRGDITQNSDITANNGLSGVTLLPGQGTNIGSAYGNNTNTINASTLTLTVPGDYDIGKSGGQNLLVNATTLTSITGNHPNIVITNAGAGNLTIGAMTNAVATNIDFNKTLTLGALTISGGALTIGSTYAPTTLNVNGAIAVTSQNVSLKATTITFGASGTVTTTTSGDVSLTAEGASSTLKAITSAGVLNFSKITTSATFTLGADISSTGDFTINTGATLDAKSGGNYGITVGGNWSNSGTFTPQSGTVTLNGTAQTISGSTTFYNLTKSVASTDTLTFTAGTTQTISNTLTLNGASSNLLSLRSSATPTQWNINPQGTRTLSYLDVKDSNNTNATGITTLGFNITNSGNNTNWNFNTAPTLTSVSDSPNPIKGGNQLTVTPAGQGDGESDALYFYCNETGSATSADTLCSQANASYASPYFLMTCTYNILTGDATRTVYCRTYDGSLYGTERTTTYTVDTTAPSGGSITYTNGYFATTSVPITYSIGTDTGSGLNNSSGKIQRAEADLSNGLCGSFGSFADLHTGYNDSPYSDATVQSAKCYQYQYLISDNVVNTATYTSANIAKIDTSIPTTTDDFTNNDTWVSSSQTITLTPTDSGGSGFAWTKYCKDTDNTCDPSTGTSYTVPVVISTEGASYFRYASQDNAGNTQTTVSRTVKIDTTAPTTTDDYTNNDVWMNASQTITLTSNCDVSGCEWTKYCLTASCDPSTGTSYTVPVAISTEGITYFRYASKDNTGSTQTTAEKIVKIDTTAPTNIGVSSITVDSSSQLTITANTAVDAGSGLHSAPYQFEETSANSGATSSGWQTSSTYTDAGLSPNVAYTYKVRAKDSFGATSDYSSTVTKYTLSRIPTSLTLTADSASQITAIWSTNSNPFGTEYYIENTTTSTNSGWITSAFWTSSGLTCNTSYAFKIKSRNGDNTETDFTGAVSHTTAGCGGGGSSSGGGGYSAPASPIGGASVLINNNNLTTDTSVVTLLLEAGSDTVRMAISNNPEFINAVQETYQSTKQWTLTEGDGDRTVYVKFFTSYGQPSVVYSDAIYLGKKAIVQQVVETTGKVTDGITKLPGEIIKGVGEIIGGITEIIRPKEITKIEFPPIEETVQKETPFAFKEQTSILPVKNIGTFVLGPMSRELTALAQKIPQLEKTFKDIGISKASDVSKLVGNNLVLPGLTETTSLAKTDVKAGGVLPEGVLVGNLTDSAKIKIPTEIVFARTGGGLVDQNVNLSVDEQGTPQQKLTVISNKSLQLIVKPDNPARAIKGYLLFRKKQPVASNGITPELATASLMQVNIKEAPVAATERLVVQEFNYLDPDKDGIWTADIVSPAVDGEYEVLTVTDYLDQRLKPTQMSLIVVVDPEGYIYYQKPEGQIRVSDAKVTLYWLNPETKLYEIWNAGRYQQTNPQTTDVTGRYSFLTPEGSYYIKVEAWGYTTFYTKEFEVVNGIGVHENIELKKSDWLVKYLDWKIIVILLMFAFLAYNFYRDRLRDKKIQLEGKGVKA